MPHGITKTAQGTTFFAGLLAIITPKDQSDRTCFRRLATWVERRVAEKEYDESIYQSLLSLARGCTGPTVKNPAALFVATCKTELGYDPNQWDK